MRLVLGIPTSGAPAQPFLESLGNLQMPSSITSFERTVVTGNYVPAQRELIVRKALASQADVLMMCDDDMILPRDALSLLLDAMHDDPSCALAGALYYSRDGFRPMAVDNWNAANTTTANVPGFTNLPVSVAGIGFGCVLVRISALRGMTAPYFSAHIYMEPTASRVRICDEDYLFCARLRELGHRVVLHAGVRCGHYDRLSGATYPLQWEDTAATTTPRMAVLHNGERKLLPLTHAQGAHERHERAEITYIWAED